jgi:flagellar FliL protein
MTQVQAGQKPPLRYLYPAKHSGRMGAGKHLLTIPTYAQSQVERTGRASAVSDPWHPLAAQSVAIGVIMAKAKRAEEEEDLDEDLEDGEEQEAVKPKGKLFSWLPSLGRPSRKVMIIAAAGLLVVGGGGGAYFYFFSNSEHEAPAKHAAAPAKPATFIDLPDVLVNLSSAANERTQYLKVKIVLEVPTPEAVTEIQPLMPRVLDTFQTYLRELRASDLDGSAGLYRLKEELTRRVNAAVAPNRVTAVLFKEIIVQ